MGLALLIVGLVGIGVIGTRQMLISGTTTEGWEHLPHRILYDLVRLTDFPLVQILIVGAWCWRRGRRKEAARYSPVPATGLKSQEPEKKSEPL
ncbi:MAG: hypothetical protein L0Y70_17325 [Gemmataceae bacterium]|nr:hypothetical protein [Gemmataceae bacterium]